MKNVFSGMKFTQGEGKEPEQTGQTSYPVSEQGQIIRTRKRVSVQEESDPKKSKNVVTEDEKAAAEVLSDFSFFISHPQREFKFDEKNEKAKTMVDYLTKEFQSIMGEDSKVKPQEMEFYNNNTIEENVKSIFRNMQELQKTLENNLNPEKVMACSKKILLLDSQGRLKTWRWGIDSVFYTNKLVTNALLTGFGRLSENAEAFGFYTQFVSKITSKIQEYYPLIFKLMDLLVMLNTNESESLKELNKEYIPDSLTIPQIIETTKKIKEIGDGVNDEVGKLNKFIYLSNNIGAGEIKKRLFGLRAIFDWVMNGAITVIHHFITYGLGWILPGLVLLYALYEAEKNTRDPFTGTSVFEWLRSTSLSLGGTIPDNANIDNSMLPRESQLLDYKYEL